MSSRFSRRSPTSRSEAPTKGELVANEVERTARIDLGFDKDSVRVIPFMITHRQKAKLRQLGRTDEEIREMTPTEAHRVLAGLDQTGSGAPTAPLTPDAAAT